MVYFHMYFYLFFVECRRWLGRSSEFQRKCRPGARGLYWGKKKFMSFFSQ